MPDTRGGRFRLIGVAAALLLFAAPLPAAAQTETPAPSTVPALSNWEAAVGSYVLGRDTRIVAPDKAAREVAGTLADDLRAAGHGTVPVAAPATW